MNCPVGLQHLRRSEQRKPKVATLVSSVPNVDVPSTNEPALLSRRLEFLTDSALLVLLELRVQNLVNARMLKRCNYHEKVVRINAFKAASRSRSRLYPRIWVSIRNSA